MGFQFKTVGLVIMLSVMFSLPADASIEIDKLKYELVQSLRAEKYGHALTLIKKLRERKASLGTEIVYFEAKSNLMSGYPEKGERLLRKYIADTKGKGENYQRAIGMIIEIDEKREKKNKNDVMERAAKVERNRMIEAEQKRVFGIIVSVNKDWGYVMIEPTNNISPIGKKVYSRLSEFETVAFKVGNRKESGQYSANVDSLDNVHIGDKLFFGVNGVDSSSQTIVTLGMKVGERRSFSIDDYKRAAKEDRRRIKIAMASLKRTPGPEIIGLTSGGPAELAGIKVGDLVDRINGVEIKSENDYSKVISSLKVGESVSIRVVRMAKHTSFTITPGGDHK